MSKPPLSPALSIIINAHCEGIIAHKTLRSVSRALKPLVVKSIPHEVIIVIDKGDEETFAYFKRQDVIPSAKIYHLEAGDLAQARNYGVEKSSGKFIATLDADDLVSENWFIDGLRFQEKQASDVILHTEWSVNFGTQDIAWHKYDSRAKSEDAIIMTWANRWDSAIIAPRTILKKFPYASNLKGFGSEDWHFNSQTLSANIPHLIVPQSILFVRRKDVSEMTIQKSDNRTVHYTDLLDSDYIKHLDVSSLQSKPLHFSPRTSQSLLQKVKPLLKRSYGLAYTLAPPIQKPLRFLKRRVKRTSKPTPRFPQYVIDEWRELHQIEKQLFPSEPLLESIPIYQSEIYDIGLSYHGITQHISRSPDYIMVVPHIISGGADLVILNYIKAIRDIYPNWHIAVVATDNTKSSWASRLPEDVDFIPFGQICAQYNLPHELQLQLFARYVVQSKCKRLHIIQSSLAFEFARKYKTLITENNYTIYACAFCEDIDNEGRYVGHIHSGIPGAYPVLKNILTDNKAVIDQLVNEYDFDRRKFINHYQPSEVKPLQSLQSHTPKKDGPFRVLWASRIAKQKRPDIIRKIAQNIDGMNIKIDIYGNLQDGFTSSYFAGLRNLEYKGGFNGVESLPIDKYDVFIYTSENDGVPNILLGMAAMGLPIIAPNRGGIGEVVIADKTGVLVPQLEDIDAYVRALKDLAAHPEKAKVYAHNAHRLVSERHSYEALRQNVSKLDMGQKNG